jgi:hypothetical protein
MRGNGVPIRVVENDDISSRQIDTKTTSPRREQENKLLAPRFIILVNRDDPIIMSRTSIDPTILCSSHQNPHQPPFPPKLKREARKRERTH